MGERARAGALVELIGGLYEVAVAPARWQGWLGDLCCVLAAQAGVVVVRFEPGVGDQAVFSVGTGDEMAAADSAVPAAPARLPPAARYLEYFAEDAKLFCKVFNLTPGELLILSEALSDHELRATRLYRDWLRPRRLHHLVSLIVSRTPRHTTGLSLLRRPQGPGFAQRELDLLRRLHPHLQRVVELQDMLVTAERKSEAADRLLESLRCGAIVLDDRGQVSGANQRAAALLERGQGLRLEGGRLRAEDPTETAALQRLVRSASEGGAARSGGALAVSRAAYRHALVVLGEPASA